MAKMKRNKILGQTTLETDIQGIPRILLATKTELLNDPLTLKLWPSVSDYISKHGGSDFVRVAITEKLQRIMDPTAKKEEVKC